MLVASLFGERIEARKETERGRPYSCPECTTPVILKAGEQKIAHFAHRAASDCSYATGETLAHLEAKRLVCDVLRDRGLKAEVEYPIDRQRADVAAWSPGGTLFVLEMQHASLPVEELSARVAGYRRNRIPQLWLPFVRRGQAYWNHRLLGDTSANHRERQVYKTYVNRYSIRPFERWLAKANGAPLWFYDEEHKQAFRTAINAVLLEREGFYSYDGEEVAPEYTYKSRRWRALDCSRLYDLSALKFKLVDRNLGVEVSVDD